MTHTDIVGFRTSQEIKANLSRCHAKLGLWVGAWSFHADPSLQIAGTARSHPPPESNAVGSDASSRICDCIPKGTIAGAHGFKVQLTRKHAADDTPAFSHDRAHVWRLRFIRSRGAVLCTPRRPIHQQTSRLLWRGRWVSPLLWTKAQIRRRTLRIRILSSCNNP